MKIKTKTSLYSTAFQCPLLAGKAVYTARSIYTKLNPYAYYDDRTTCTHAGIQYRTQAPKTQTNKAKRITRISPNPANKYIHAETNMAWQPYTSIQGINAQGAVVFTYTILDSATSIDLQLLQVPPGMYQIRIASPNEAPFIQKLIIQP